MQEPVSLVKKPDDIHSMTYTGGEFLLFPYRDHVADVHVGNTVSFKPGQSRLK